MFPCLHLGSVRIPTFGIMAAAAFLVATFLCEKEFRRKGFPRNTGWDTTLLAIIAGLIGSKINFLIEHPGAPGGFLQNLLSGNGLTWYGGFILGLIAVLIFWRIRGISALSALDAVAPALAAGYAVARIGCQLSGDGDYGRPSNLPWAMSYPNGTVPTTVRVHPSPVYETLIMLAVFCVLWRLRRGKFSPGFLFWLYLVGQGLERFFIEFVRRNPPVLAGMTEAQVVSIIMVVAGIVLILSQPGRRPVPGAGRNR
jgi:phosphatidylglycerol:prolipoprotein diacylglycerol transferase